MAKKYEIGTAERMLVRVAEVFARRRLCGHGDSYLQAVAIAEVSERIAQGLTGRPAVEHLKLWQRVCGDSPPQGFAIRVLVAERLLQGGQLG